jgi:hypothetical protein
MPAGSRLSAPMSRLAMGFSRGDRVSVRGRLATITGWLYYLVRYDDGERDVVWYSEIMLIERRK